MDKKEAENAAAGHLSHLVLSDSLKQLPIKDTFPDEQLFGVSQRPWYADIVNYLAMGILPSYWNLQYSKKFLAEIKHFFLGWSPFKHCPYQILRRCVPDSEQLSVISFCHSHACGGHFSAKKIAIKILQCGSYWPPIFKDNHQFCKNVKDIKHWVPFLVETWWP